MTPSATSCRTGASRGSIAAWCATSRSRPRRRGSARFPATSIRACSRFMRCRCRGTRRGDARRDPQGDRQAEDDRCDRCGARRCTRRARKRRPAARAGRQPGLANALAEYQTRYGDWRELFLQLDKVDKVTKADIRRVANQVLSTRTAPARRSIPKRPAARREERRRAMKISCRSRAVVQARGFLPPCVGGLAVPRPGCAAQQASRGRRFRFRRCMQFNPQQPKRIELKNGIVRLSAGRS